MPIDYYDYNYNELNMLFLIVFADSRDSASQIRKNSNALSKNLEVQAIDQKPLFVPVRSTNPPGKGRTTEVATAL